MPVQHDVLALLHQHRSIRSFAPDLVSEEDVAAAVRAGQMASTSSAVQAYCVVRIRDAATRRTLVRLTGDQEKVAEAGAFLAICGDTRRHRLVGQRNGKQHAANLESFLVAVVDASLFAQNLVVAFEALGYGICYIGGLRTEPYEVDRLLNLPEGVYPLFGLCVGRAAESPAERPRLPLEAVLFEERYPDDAAMLAALDRYDETYRSYLADRGAKPVSWTTRMAEKFATLERDNLRAYYASKGATI